MTSTTPIHAGTSVEGNIADSLRRLLALDPGLLANPYPLYKEMRENAPVVRVGPQVLVSRYEDIKNVLRNDRLFSSRRQSSSVVEARIAALSPDELVKYEHIIGHDSNQLALMDDPGHARLRNFVTETFSAKRIAEMRGVLSDISNELLDDIEARGLTRFDFIGDYSFHVPFRAICHILGVPREDSAKIREWGLVLSAGLSTTYENLDEAFDALKNFSTYIEGLIAEARANPDREDLVAQLVNAKDDEGVYLTDVELVAMFVQMLVSGNTNTLLANVMVALAENPSERARLLETPELIRGSVDEFIRYASSIHAIRRTATEDTEIGGFPIRKHETLLLLLASGNHDPEKFENADVLDVTRKGARQHLGLGFGIHTCLGQWLLRLDAEVALAVLLERYPNIHLDGPVEYRQTFVQHGPERLYVAM